MQYRPLVERIRMNFDVHDIQLAQTVFFLVDRGPAACTQSYHHQTSQYPYRRIASSRNARRQAVSVCVIGYNRPGVE